MKITDKKAEKNNRFNNPLAGKIESTSKTDKKRVKVMLSEDIFFIKDNFLDRNITNDKLQGKFMPVINYLEMVRLAGEMTADKSVKRIEDVTLIQAILVSRGSSKIDINLISYKEQTNKKKFKVSSVNNKERVVNAQGKIIYENDVETESQVFSLIDPAKAKERFQNTMKKEEYYQFLEENTYRVGSSLQSVEEFYYNENDKNEALSKLKLPVEVQERSEDYMLHPSLMEGALQTIVGLKLKSPFVEEEMKRTIFSFGEVEIINGLTEECYVYTKFSEDHFSSSSFNKYDMQIIDRQGRLLIDIKNICMKEPLVDW